ncbi:hypothetical protein [Euhalothece natronophila]|nr:hypothetical protein [Euhalothece natronophila]
MNRLMLALVIFISLLGVAKPLSAQENNTRKIVQEDMVTCPEGQFPSPFSDVRPDHWAYEAILRVSSPPIQCFEETQ